MSNYYEQQLNQLDDTGFVVKIQLCGTRMSDGEFIKTNYIDLNLESIAALRSFLDTIENELD